MLFNGLTLGLINMTVRIGLVYILSGFGGSLLSVMRMKRSVDPSISVGASGALFGLLGSMLSELLTNWSIYTNKVKYNLIQFVFFIAQLNFEEFKRTNSNPLACWLIPSVYSSSDACDDYCHKLGNGIITQGGQFSSYWRIRLRIFAGFCVSNATSIWIHKPQENSPRVSCQAKS